MRSDGRGSIVILIMENVMPDLAFISLGVSILSLLIAATTAWFALLRKGAVRMTQPTVVIFAPDPINRTLQSAPPKIFLRTLLFSTSKRGRHVESLHVCLSLKGVCQKFTSWGYETDMLVQGSGLFVGETGVAAYHHFQVHESCCEFRLGYGRYDLEVYA